MDKENAIFLSPKDLIINEGISANGKQFKMISLNRALVNSDTFIEMARTKGARVFKKNAPASVALNK